MKRLLSAVLAVIMLVTVFPITVFADLEAVSADSSITTNPNRESGVIMNKIATPHLGSDGKPDGTIDIAIEAYTTGVVTNTVTVTPADIILVLDMSRSMEDGGQSQTVYEYPEVYGGIYQRRVSNRNINVYGFSSTNTSYYVLVNGQYVRVTYSGRDGNNFDYYVAGSGTNRTYYYPILKEGPTNTSPAEDYATVQFHTRSSRVEQTGNKLQLLKESVAEFIDETLRSNGAITSDEDKHSIGIIEFATNASWVKGLTVVDETGAAALKTAVNGLTTDISTAVDKGLKLAHDFFNEKISADYHRNQVLVVFTDGEPNHWMNYDEAVAADSVLLAKSIKDIGVTVFTICIDDNADASAAIPSSNKDINKFMHYLSSNFPNATANSNDILDDGISDSEVAAAMARGYYQTPNQDISLASIFQEIAQSIETPTIEIGENATIIDTISPYFSIPNGTNSITIYTADKTADGWDDPEAAPEISYSLQSGRTLAVSGFDFDENYVSETPRDNFYGKKLIISFNVTPDYAALDAAAETIATSGGMVPTNQGDATLNDSNMTPVASVSSPALQAYAVTYEIKNPDGSLASVYKKVYRFDGSNTSVLEKPADTAAYTYSDWTSNDVTIDQNGNFIMPDEDITIQLTRTPKSYQVIYKYTGTTPSGAPDLPETRTYTYGSTVTIADPVSLTGYNFVGWNTVSTTVSGNSFTMPAHDVELTGYFNAGTVTYTVEHYLQNADGTWPTTPSTSHKHDGTTDSTVSALETIAYPNFKLNKEHPNAVLSGKVKADGSLVLKLYYNRDQYKVTYQYLSAPANAPALPVEATYYYGQDVRLAAVPTVPGYTFVGWATDGADVIITDVADGKYITMPARNVVIKGTFNANSGTSYAVEHYLETNPGSYTLHETTTHTGTTDTRADAVPGNYAGYSHNTEHPNKLESGIIAGDGSLVLRVYYKRDPYQVTYTITGEYHPAGVTAPITKNHIWGTTVPVEANPSAYGYVFSGWITDDATVDGNGNFVMPAHNVEFVGFFTREEAEYTVEHYLMSPLGVYPDTPTESYTQTGHVGDSVTASYIPTFKNLTPDYDRTGTLTGTIVSNQGGSKLVLKLYYKRIESKVTYSYTSAPAGAPELPDEAICKAGSTVSVATVPYLEGYTFLGWTSADVEVSDNASFTMPNKDVHFTGYFEANSDTKYTVEHYVEELNGSYTLHKTTTHNGTTDETVTATAETFYGYTLNATHEDRVESGKVEGDGSLVLELYYDRNSYEVRYNITSKIAPAGIETPKNKTYKWGTTVPVEPGYEVTGYLFNGWNTEDADLLDGAEFIMPINDVDLNGEFSIHYAKYTVEHYLQDTDGNWPTEPTTSHTHDAMVGTEVTAVTTIEYPHFTLDLQKEGTVQSDFVKADGSVVLKLYYTRAQYNVTYRYISAPETAPAVPVVQNPIYYGKTVTIASVPTMAGYTFIGWATDRADVMIIDGAITMPAHDVVIQGTFIANDDTLYKVEHYVETTDNNYTLRDTTSHEGVTDEMAYALPGNYTGYTHIIHKNSVESGKILGDGTLVLKVYYDKAQYTVHYSISGNIPEGASIDPDFKEFHDYMDTVTVVAPTEVYGYRFVGWTTTNVTPDSNGKFSMPAYDVYFSGYYVKTIAAYTVVHYLQNTDGTWPETSEHTSTTIGNIGSTVSEDYLMFEGFTPDRNHEGTILSDTVKSDGTTVLKLFYTRNKYKVTYSYTSAPEGTPAPAEQEYYYKELVPVAGQMYVNGYEFYGWTTTDVEVDVDEFFMPADDVHFTGYFVAHPSKYIVEHYKQNLDGSYNELPDESEEFTDVKVGDYVVAQFKSYTGFSPVTTGEGIVYSGIVTPESTPLTIKLYYTRNAYNVTYVYYGVQPDGAPDVSVNNLVGILYGDEVTIADVPTLTDYMFDGWKSLNADLSGETFLMPGHDVILYGNFVLSRAAYKVEHYLQNADGTWPETTPYSNITKGKIGETVTADFKEISGYTADEDNPNNIIKGIVNEAGTLVLKLYYTRNKYTVRYYVDDDLYASFEVCSNETHTIIDTPKYNALLHFNGWYAPVNAETQQTIPTTNGEFVMPEADVNIHGTLKMIPILSGRLNITKQLEAPAGFNTNYFNFSIYREESGNKIFVKTVKVKAGGSIDVDLISGIYYVYEENAEVDGYTLFTTTDVADNRVVVNPAQTGYITFKNCYYENILVTEDHFAYIIGYPDGLVRPEANITRAEVATIFFRMMTDEARATYWSKTNSFSDVSDSDWFNNAVSTLANAGIIDGYEDGTFKPDAYITRAELVKIAVSFFGTSADQVTRFADASDHWAASYIAAAEAFGFIDGYEDETFRPNRYITRAEAMKVINRTLGRNPHKDQLLPNMITWADNTFDKWYYADVQEATNSHLYSWAQNGFEVWKEILPVRDWASLEKEWSDAYGN